MKDAIRYLVLYTSGGIHRVDKGPIAAVPCAGTGSAAHYFEGHGLVNPDYDAVRACLPHYWRRAWDRKPGAWFPRTAPDSPAHVTLNGRRGKPLGTIYLQPIRVTA